MERRDKETWQRVMRKRIDVARSMGAKSVHLDLTQDMECLVDIDMADELINFMWCAAKDDRDRWYAITSVPDKNGRYHNLYMHRYVLGIADQSVLVDHINHDTLDNRRENLRPTTKSENTWNSRTAKNKDGGYLGVSLDRASGKWRARIQVNNNEVSLGYFDTAEEAARVRDEAAKKYHGEFAVLNFQEER